MDTSFDAPWLREKIHEWFTNIELLYKQAGASSLFEEHTTTQWNLELARVVRAKLQQTDLRVIIDF